VRPDALYHFSTEPGIERFAPHVPRTNPSHPPAVWAIDAQHAPLYWFPRDCPRVTVWSRGPGELAEFQARFTTAASRVHAMEAGWIARMGAATIYRYELDVDGFVPWEDASGQWICDREVTPKSVTPMNDLVTAHVDAGIELRIVPSLWPLHDEVLDAGFDFSMVRMRNAAPRLPS
jgi:Family of unknown function (DUF6886)